MFRLAHRIASARALQAARQVTAVSRRSLATSQRVASDHGSEPIIVGKGAAAGAVPTDQQQATGVERLQLLGEMEGYNFFDMDPVYIDRLGTPKDPIVVQSYGYSERLVGCSGFPVESHEIIWMNANAKKLARCPECGCTFKLEVGEAREEHHH